VDDEARVGGHLNALSICHYVYAALAFCFSGFGLIYVFMGQFVGWAIENAPTPQGQPPMPQPPSELFTWFFSIFGFALTGAALTVSLLCFLSARALNRRQNRTLSLVVAGIVCVTGLLGIALGVFTFIVLLKPETERLYAAKSAPQ
jgi:hypothetical protein